MSTVENKSAIDEDDWTHVEAGEEPFTEVEKSFSHIAVYSNAHNGSAQVHCQDMINEIREKGRKFSIRDFQPSDKQATSLPVLEVVKKTILDSGLDDSEILESWAERTYEFFGKYPEHGQVSFGIAPTAEPIRVVFDFGLVKI